MKTEEKAKAYDEALNWMRELYPGLHGATKEDAEHYFPELRESEDERIRKGMIRFLESEQAEGMFTHEARLSWIAYLEKQKDHFRDDTKMVEQKPRDYCSLRDEFDLEGNLVQKPISTEDMPYITDEHFYEREPADSFKYKLAEYMTKCCTKKEGPYGYTYSISAEAILKMAEEELLKRGVVQKPADDKAFEEWIDDWWKHSKINNPDSYDKGDEIQFDEKGFKNFCRGIRNMYANQESAEWSEEDEDMLNSCISSIEEAKENRYAYKETDGDTSYDHEIAWLKSLRPQHHKEIYQAAKRDLAIKFMNYLDENRPAGKMSLSNGECEDIDKAFKENDWSKIIRYIEKYQPHWKPSEEQMYALKRYSPVHHPDVHLVSLYDDLKKLM